MDGGKYTTELIRQIAHIDLVVSCYIFGLLRQRLFLQLDFYVEFNNVNG